MFRESAETIFRLCSHRGYTNGASIIPIWDCPDQFPLGLVLAQAEKERKRVFERGGRANGRAERALAKARNILVHRDQDGREISRHSTKRHNCAVCVSGKARKVALIQAAAAANENFAAMWYPEIVEIQNPLFPEHSPLLIGLVTRARKILFRAYQKTAKYYAFNPA